MYVRLAPNERVHRTLDRTSRDPARRHVGPRAFSPPLARTPARARRGPRHVPSRPLPTSRVARRGRGRRWRGQERDTTESRAETSPSRVVGYHPARLLLLLFRFWGFFFLSAELIAVGVVGAFLLRADGDVTRPPPLDDVDVAFASSRFARSHPTMAWNFQPTSPTSH